MTDAQAQQAIVNAGLQARILETRKRYRCGKSRDPPESRSRHKGRQKLLRRAHGEQRLTARRFERRPRVQRGGRAANAPRRQIHRQIGSQASITRPKTRSSTKHPKPGTKRASRFDRHAKNLERAAADRSAELRRHERRTMPIALAKRSGISLDTTNRVADPQYANDVVSAQNVPPGAVHRPQHGRASDGEHRRWCRRQCEPNGRDPERRQHEVWRCDFAIERPWICGGRSVFGAIGTTTVSSSRKIQPRTSQAPSGSRVTVTLSVSGEVPDTNGDTLADAQAALAADGYSIAKIQNSSEGADGKVVGTEPEVGTTLQPGSSVTLIVNGPYSTDARARDRSRAARHRLWRRAEFGAVQSRLWKRGSFHRERTVHLKSGSPSCTRESSTFSSKPNPTSSSSKSCTRPIRTQ